VALDLVCSGAMNGALRACLWAVQDALADTSIYFDITSSLCHTYDLVLAQDCAECCSLAQSALPRS
jgi:hypothetical protein